MTAVQLLLQLRSLNVELWLEGETLRYNAPPGVLDGSLLGRLKAYEPEIRLFLTEPVGTGHLTDGVAFGTEYVEMRDGVQLAVDVFRPKRDGAVVTEALPVIWCHDRYHRSALSNGALTTKLDTRPWLREVLGHGYVIAVADARGSGASTGVRATEFGAEEVQDAYELTEWFARQPWCSGAVGMYGDSYRGIMQLLTAAAGPPHLRAIFPEMAMFDLYASLYPGGVFRHDFVQHWSRMVQQLDTDGRVAPIAGGGQRIEDILRSHGANADVSGVAAAAPYRDDRDPVTGAVPHEDQSPHTRLDRIAASNVAIHHLSGWYDLWVRDALLWMHNLPNPQKLVIGGWHHTDRAGIDLASEHLRWYDRWLKGIDNGVMDEAPIRYFTMSARPGRQWRSAWSWPPEQARPMTLYFGSGPTGTVGSVNDGTLSTTTPGDDGDDEYVVDYTTTSGRTTRWSNAYGTAFRYQLSGNDRRALTYTTEPLTEDVEVTGHPVAHLFVTSTHPDGDFFVYLEEVDEQGESHYVTEGVLRASHRATGPAPYRLPGLPYHPGTREAAQDLPLLPVELVIDLHPTSNVFVAGRRIRVAVTCCDKDNAQTPMHEPAPVVRLYRHSDCPSSIVLPVMPNEPA